MSTAPVRGDEEGVPSMGFIWTPPVCQDRFWCVGTDRLQFYIRPVVQAGCLLALMESADPRLISPKDSKSSTPYRLGGSRSDLFAITLYRPCATFTAATPFFKVVDAVDTRCAPALYGLTHKLSLVRPFMGQHRPDRPRHLVGQCHHRHIEWPTLT